jgi:aminopeptidase N
MALVISHELSHHWFGNYVTMVWWDDLWLNESFAEWISCYSIEKLKDNLLVKF